MSCGIFLGFHVCDLMCFMTKFLSYSLSAGWWTSVRQGWRCVRWEASHSHRPTEHNSHLFCHRSVKNLQYPPQQYKYVFNMSDNWSHCLGKSTIKKKKSCNMFEKFYSGMKLIVTSVRAFLQSVTHCQDSPSIYQKGILIDWYLLSLRYMLVYNTFGLHKHK